MFEWHGRRYYLQMTYQHPTTEITHAHLEAILQDAEAANTGKPYYIDRHTLRDVAMRRG